MHLNSKKTLVLVVVPGYTFSFFLMNYLSFLLLTKLKQQLDWSCTWGKSMGFKFIVRWNINVVILMPWIKISQYKITLPVSACFLGNATPCIVSGTVTVCAVNGLISKVPIMRRVVLHVTAFRITKQPNRQKKPQTIIDYIIINWIYNNYKESRWIWKERKNYYVHAWTGQEKN